MVDTSPKFTRSKYFVAKPDWHLKDGASAEDKKTLEEYMNSGDLPGYWKVKHPEMKKPYYTWSGKVIDKG